MTSGDLEKHPIELKTKFAIDPYVYHVYLAMFQIFDLKMTSFDLKDDLGWPWDAHHRIQNKICNRFICISCAFGHISDLWPQSDLFDPYMTLDDLR